MIRGFGLLYPLSGRAERAVPVDGAASRVRLRWRRMMAQAAADGRTADMSGMHKIGGGG